MIKAVRQGHVRPAVSEMSIITRFFSRLSEASLRLPWLDVAADVVDVFILLGIADSFSFCARFMPN